MPAAGPERAFLLSGFAGSWVLQSQGVPVAPRLSFSLLLGQQEGCCVLAAPLAVWRASPVSCLSGARAQFSLLGRLPFRSSFPHKVLLNLAFYAVCCFIIAWQSLGPLCFLRNFRVNFSISLKTFFFGGDFIQDCIGSWSELERQS